MTSATPAKLLEELVIADTATMRSLLETVAQRPFLTLGHLVRQTLDVAF
jgi:hypothetical protein